MENVAVVCSNYKNPPRRAEVFITSLQINVTDICDFHGDQSGSFHLQLGGIIIEAHVNTRPVHDL